MDLRIYKAFLRAAKEKNATEKHNIDRGEEIRCNNDNTLSTVCGRTDQGKLEPGSVALGSAGGSPPCPRTRTTEVRGLAHTGAVDRQQSASTSYFFPTHHTR